jgi:hypothetical protein
LKVNYGLWVAFGHGLWFQIEVSGFRFQVSGFRFYVPGLRFSFFGSGFGVGGLELRVKD